MDKNQDDIFTSGYEGMRIKFRDANNEIIYKRDRSGDQESIEIDGKEIDLSKKSKMRSDRIFHIGDIEYSIAFGRQGFFSKVVECTLNKNTKPLQRYVLKAKSQVKIWHRLLVAVILGAIWLVYKSGLMPQVHAIILTIILFLLRYALQPIPQWSCEEVSVQE
jgi:hypothetical protein